MFEKLLSALPFNPGLVHQLAFYGKRMRAEQSLRRIGVVFLVGAFLIQFFAFTSPPKSTSAASSNDLINGGFTSAAEAANDCNSNLQDYATILANYGITCAKVASAPVITINSDGWNKQLYSMGRNPYNIAGETPITIPNLSYPLYARYLWGWDSPGTSSNYQALNVTTVGGQTFLLLLSCGNLTSVGFPQPVVPSPNITVSKTTDVGSPQANSNVAPGTVMSYKIYFNNIGGPATNVYLTDPAPPYTSEVSMGGGSTSSSFTNNAAVWFDANMPAGANNWWNTVSYKISDTTPNGTKICNTATIRSDQTAPLTTQPPVCVTVVVNAPPPPPTPSGPPCEQQISSENPSACITIHKSASNLTESVNDANGTTAQAGDLIKYTLSATNNGSGTVKNYVFEDSLAYILDYGTVVDKGGATVSSSNDIVWPGVDIGAGKTVSKTFEVRVDNPIPQTPPSTSDPNLFNLKMTNTFGNTITIKLPPTAIKAVETTATALPNTGPGTSVLIGAAVVAFAGFFYYRSRLLARESSIAVKESSGV